MRCNKNKNRKKKENGKVRSEHVLQEMVSREEISWNRAIQKLNTRKLHIVYIISIYINTRIVLHT